MNTNNLVYELSLQTSKLKSATVFNFLEETKKKTPKCFDFPNRKLALCAAVKNRRYFLRNRGDDEKKKSFNKYLLKSGASHFCIR